MSQSICQFISDGASTARLALVAFALLCMAESRSVRASDHAPAAEGGEGAKATSTRTDLLDLGQFRVRGCRSTDQEVFDIQFGLHLVLTAQTTASDIHRLESWKNRIRDQVIIAVRSAEPADFSEPELRRLQRLILFRVKRLATDVGIIGVYLTDFSLDEGETMEDLMRPPVTPSAPAPAKKAEGGH